MSDKKKTWMAVAIVVAVIVIDQIIKVWVKTHMALGEEYVVADWFRIHFTENKGMAFGMSPASTWLLTLFRVVAVGLFTYFLRRCIRRQMPTGLIVCLSLIIAGAAGNIIDNCFYGLIFTESLPYYEALHAHFAATFSTGSIAGTFSTGANLVAPGQGYGTFLSGRVVDMFYFPLWQWPESWPGLGGSTFFGAIFNFADAAISCGAGALRLFYSRYLQNDKSDKKDKSKATHDDRDAKEDKKAPSTEAQTAAPETQDTAIDTADADTTPDVQMADMFVIDENE